MVTRTDANSLRALDAAYTPAQFGVVSAAENQLITDTLELKARSNIELQNIRDFSVLFYGQALQKTPQNSHQTVANMDKLSAITAVIDLEKTARGLPV